MKPYGPAYAMLAVLGLATPAWAAGPPGDRFGIALQEPNGVCLYTDSRLRPGSAVAIVIPLPPQDAATAYAVYFGPGCAGSGGRAGVRLVPPGVMGRNTIALAVFGPGAGVTVTDGSALIRAGTDTPYTVRICSSDKGVHLTAWLGAPLQGQRVYHGVVARPRTGEPDCTDAEEAEPS